LSEGKRNDWLLINQADLIPKGTSVKKERTMNSKKGLGLEKRKRSN